MAKRLHKPRATVRERQLNRLRKCAFATGCIREVSRRQIPHRLFAANDQKVIHAGNGNRLIRSRKNDSPKREEPRCIAFLLFGGHPDRAIGSD